jgi:hypothetical protein
MSNQQSYRRYNAEVDAMEIWDEQRDAWILTTEPSRSTAVARRPASPVALSDGESRVMEQGYQVAQRAQQRPARAQSARPVQPRDDALTHAHAARVAALPKLVVFGGVTALLLLILLVVHPFDVGAGWYFVAALLAWGGYSLRALNYDRAVGLRYSSAGVELEREVTDRHDISSRERVAMHALDTHLAYLRERLDRGLE